MADDELKQLLNEWRAGNEEARDRLLTRMEGLLRAIVRKLMGRGIRSDRESMDVCQSLLLAFHMGLADGGPAIEDERALRAYLASMVRHKLANLSDRIRAAKRGGGVRPAPIDGPGDEDRISLPAADPTASMVAGAAEAHRKVQDLLDDEERVIFAGRLTGRSNREIADQLGKSPDAVRMIWNRARERLKARGVIE